LKTPANEAIPDPVFGKERNCAAVAILNIVYAASASSTDALGCRAIARDLTKDWRKDTPTTLGKLLAALANQALPTMRIALVTATHALAFIAGRRPDKPNGKRAEQRLTETSHGYILWVDDKYSHITASKDRINFPTALPLLQLSEITSRLRAGNESTEWALMSSTSSSTSDAQSTSDESTDSTDDTSSSSSSSDASSSPDSSPDAESGATSEPPSDSDSDFIPTSRTWTKIEFNCRRFFNIQNLDDGGTEEDSARAFCILEAMQQTVTQQIYSAGKAM
jgi:hypothetical protein